MDTNKIVAGRLSNSVIAVPPLARDAKGNLSLAENARLVQHLERGGISTLLYGGNAMLYHLRLSEFAGLLEMLVQISGAATLVVPSVGPAFGMMMDQAQVLRDFEFPTAMILPQKEICDQEGLAIGIRRFAESYGRPIVLYLKHDRWLAPSIVHKLYQDGLISWIKYAVVRDDPRQDDYLREVLQVVPGDWIVSGIGEQPAIIHLRDFGVNSFTSGCVCIAPALSMQMLRLIQAGDFQQADLIRQKFKPLEDLRNSLQPIRVLHQAVAAAAIAQTGPIQPMFSGIIGSAAAEIAQAAKALLELEHAR
jgi:dihydrodipicolinate synthase/N-acetylneuraminate lyase